VVAVDMTYYLKYKKNGILIIKEDDVIIVIYKPHPLDRPKMLKLDFIDSKEAPNE
jgi:hypothetical protein